VFARCALGALPALLRGTGMRTHVSTPNPYHWDSFPPPPPATIFWHHKSLRLAAAVHEWLTQLGNAPVSSSTILSPISSLPSAETNAVPTPSRPSDVATLAGAPPG
jgi:hypothetical protein